MMRWPVCVAVLCAVRPAGVHAQDVLVLTNGDHLTGQLTGIADGKWSFKHAGGVLQLAATDVAAFTSAAEVGVRLQDGTLATGRVVTTDGQMRLVAADGSTRPITAADLAAVGSPTDLESLRAVHVGFLSPFGRFWSATIGAGFASKSGNSRARGFNGDLGVERKTAKDRLAFGVGAATQWSGDPADPTSDLVKVVEKYYGAGRLDVFVSRAFFLFVGTQQERDQFQGIDLRSNYGAGVGVQAVATDPTDLRFDVSGGLRYENFTPAAGDTSTTTPIASAGGRLQQKLGPLAFDWSLRWTPAVDDVKDYRFLSEAGLSTTIFKGLGFRIGSRNEYNNNPPPGIEKHDWLFTTNLTYTLGS